MNRTLVAAATLLASGVSLQAHAATATFIVSSPYASFADSPFASIGAANPLFFLEDFEDGALNSPGVSATASIVTPAGGATTDSVDGDDGALDGNGNGGRSLYANSTSITFTFDANVLGYLPTHVGIVWTDVGENLLPMPFGKDDVLVRAFDANGNSLGFAGADALGDGSINGGTGEDTFLGAIFSGGISKLTIVSLGGTIDWEVDHLQYGVQPIPVPGAALLFGSALAGLAGLRRRV